MKALRDTQITHSAGATDLRLVNGDQAHDYSIDPVTLAYIDYGLFKSLRKLGVSRERVCSALSLAYRDYDYLLRLSSREVAQRQI